MENHHSNMYAVPVSHRTCHHDDFLLFIVYYTRDTTNSISQRSCLRFLITVEIKDICYIHLRSLKCDKKLSLFFYPPSYSLHFYNIRCRYRIFNSCLSTPNTWAILEQYSIFGIWCLKGEFYW